MGGLLKMIRRTDPVIPRPRDSAGFDNKERPWTIEEQENAVEKMKKIQEMNSKMDLVPFHP